MARVTVVEGDKTETFELGASNTIGRDSSCIISLTDPLASRMHAEIRQLEGEHLVFVDLNSTHGSYVSGSRITTHTLSDGDEVVIGTTRLLFDLGIDSAKAESIALISLESSKPWVQTRLTTLSVEHFLPEAEVTSDKELRRNYEKLRATYELSRAVGAEQDVDTVLECIVETAFRLLPAERVAILLLDPHTGAATPRVARLRDGGGEKIVLSKTIINEVMTTKAGMILADAGEDSRFSDVESVMAEGIRSAMCVPMLHGNDLIGLLHLDSLIASGIFTQGDLELFGTIANQAALAIKNAMLVQDVQKEARTRVQFQRFLPPSLVTQLLQGEMKLAKSGKSFEVTVLFSDIRGFTSMSEQMQPDQIMSMLNAYFEVMVDVLFQHNGTLDKYVGDELMALFGAPVPFADSPLCAVRCALDMQQALLRFNQDLIRQGDRPLQVGIGIHTGPAICGTLGSSKAMQYTAIGDTVNTGARLCSVARPGQIIVSAETMEQVGDQIVAVSLPDVSVKGKQKPLRIYNATGSRED